MWLTKLLLNKQMMFFFFFHVPFIVRSAVFASSNKFEPLQVGHCCALFCATTREKHLPNLVVRVRTEKTEPFCL